jgi:hypothetical protein
MTSQDQKQQCVHPVCLRHETRQKWLRRKTFVFEQTGGYVKALEKSTARVLSWGEVYEHCAQGLGRRKEPESRI